MVTEAVYDNANQVTWTKNDATGRVTTSFYDQDEKPTDSYGPAPASCFGSNNLPNGTCSSPPVAHSNTQYDTNLPGGPNGLAAEYWGASDFSGPAKFHEYLTSNLSYNWGTSSPSGLASQGIVANWTGRLTGRVQMAATGTYSFAWQVDDSIRVYIDDTLVASHWPGETDYSGTFNNTTANSSHRIRVDFGSPRQV